MLYYNGLDYSTFIPDEFNELNLTELEEENTNF